MDPTVPPLAYAAVLLGAMLHAGWNVVVRHGRDRAFETALVVAGGAVLALLILPFLRQPAAAAWPHLLLSCLLHVAYFGLLAAAYERAGVAVVYPLMRGVAPLLVLLVAVWWFAEPLTPLVWVGVLTLCAGVLLMRGRPRPDAGAGQMYALANAVVIAAYTLNDAAGVRLSGAPVAYALWIFPLTAFPTLVWLRRGAGTSATPSPGLKMMTWSDVLRGLGGGASSLASYALALWALTVAPVAPVAALRETAMLFGVALARLTLHERVPARTWVAVLLIALGAAALRLG
ncbi:MAG: EamA family transporter [Burkholderiales bacterium]|jgi:uncharacterized membrane protein|nr:EamA family transporter [Burkholderiales bacterium]